MFFCKDFGLAACVLVGAAHGALAQDQLLREAARLDGEHKCAEAESIYRQVLGKGTATPALLNNVGLHYLICGQPGEAKTYFERVLRLQPAHQNANLQLAQIAAGERRGAEALGYLSKVREVSPVINLLRAEALHWAGKPGEARALVEKERDTSGGNPERLFAVGATSGRLGLWDLAEQAFGQLLSRTPGDFRVLLFYGKAAARAGHTERAQRALEAALRLRPQDADGLAELGLLHLAKQEYDRAVFVLANARKQASGRPDILLALARAADGAGFYGDAVLAYDEYLKRYGGDDSLHRDRARVLALTGHREAEGVAQLEEYARKHPKDALGHLYLAHFTWKNEPEAALRQLTTAIGLQPALAAARHARGWLLLRMGRTKEAIQDLQAAAAATGDHPQVLTQLGLAYLTLEQHPESEKVLRRAVAAAPENPEATLHLGRTLMALGREEEAARMIERYRRLRPQAVRGPRREPGMIAAATLSAQDLATREIERLRSESRAHPEQAELQAALASLLLVNGRAEEGQAEYRALLARGADAQILAKAGAELFRLEQYQLAKAFLKRAAPERPKVRLDLALTMLRTGAPQKALEILAQVPLAERSAEHLLAEAQALESTGRVQEADKILQGDLLGRAMRPQSVRRAVSMLLRRNRGMEAEQVAAQAARQNPDAPELLLLQAAVRVLQDSGGAGAKGLDEVNARWPEWDEPYLAQGLLLEASGRKDEALKKLRTAALLGSKDPALQCALDRLAGEGCSCAPGLRDWLAGVCAERAAR